MTGFGAAFVDGDNHLTDHHLGDIVLQFFFPNNTSVACNFLLRDQGIDEGVNMWANGVVLFFGERLADLHSPPSSGGGCHGCCRASSAGRVRAGSSNNAQSRTQKGDH
jgi:hypothetical protein